MRYVIFMLVMGIILNLYVVSRCFCYDRCNTIFKWFNVIMFCCLFLLCFFGMSMFTDGVFDLSFVVISIFCFLYSIGIFTFVFINRNKYISLFSVKSALDKSFNGVMFFNKKGDLIHVNSVMKRLLGSLGINGNYLNGFISKSFKKVGDGYLIRNGGDIWFIRSFFGNEIQAILVTDIYNLMKNMRLKIEL